ncbi:MAG: sialidase family protein [Pseudomonadota bacterium]
MRLTRRLFLLQAAVLAPAAYYLGVYRRPQAQPVRASVPATFAQVGAIQALGNGRWIRCFQAADATLYLHGGLASHDGGRTVQPQQAIDVEAINATPERAVLATPDMFYAVGGRAEPLSPGRYRLRAWRSTDGLRTLAEEQAQLEIPAGSPAPEEDAWYGLYVHRNILVMPDGSWLLTMYGNFSVDRQEPPDRSSRHEVKYMMRSFVLTSSDAGRNWRFLATVAAPRPDDPIGEGFVEPTMTRLDDGRLLCIMRTGHHYPLYASWSSDHGRSWTSPVYTGLDRGCSPCVITLGDGRVALGWGRRYPEAWSRLDEAGDVARFEYPGHGQVCLALSSDGGTSWMNQVTATGVGSCYPTIIEVEPGVIFTQVDQWIWRITLARQET